MVNKRFSKSQSQKNFKKSGLWTKFQLFANYMKNMDRRGFFLVKLSKTGKKLSYLDLIPLLKTNIQMD